MAANEKAASIFFPKRGKRRLVAKRGKKNGGRKRRAERLFARATYAVCDTTK
jgi:hypothetical protein